MNADQTPEQVAPRSLDAIAAAFAARGLLATPEATRALDEARTRAALTLAAGDNGSSTAGLASAPFAGALLIELLVGRDADADADADALRGLAAELARLGVLQLALLREALRTPALLTLDPGQARLVALRALAVCAPVRHVSVFWQDSVGGAECRAHVGAGSSSPAARRLARALTAGEHGAFSTAGEMVGAAILRAGDPVAALVARCRRDATASAVAFLAEACAPLAVTLERDTRLASSATAERMLLQASERRLTRLGYDLHDGPLQELLLVGEDLALLRRQLAVVLEGRRGRELLGGRLDDLDARLLALERGLRGISSSVHSGVLVTQPFRDALRDLLEQFGARTGIDPTLECDGELDSISTSQRLAVLSVLGEALNNVREHGRANAVHVAIALTREGLRASVRDDGRGFEVESELIRAARNGRMGLAGMHERVRLLDGHCRVESRPGGPTEVTLALPRWQGSVVGADDGAAAAGAERR
jgi:signal transduction histidine kinase